MNILLKEVTSDNWIDCVDLKVAENQKNFVASNSFSLAQSKYETDCIPMCIYDDETMIGFVMFGVDKAGDDNEKTSDEFWICRFMVDEKFQGKGYGKASLGKVIEHAKNNYNYDKIYLSEVPENVVAKGLYKSFGFEFTGEIEEEEEVMILKLK